MSLNDKVAELVKKVPARAWLDYSQRFGRESQDCLTDVVIAMIVVLNEQHKKDAGKGDLERFLDMGLAELEAEIRKALDVDDEPTEGASFRSDGGDRGAVAGDAAADGLGSGRGAQPGSHVSGDGNPTL